MSEIKEFEMEMATVSKEKPPISSRKVEALVNLSMKYMKYFKHVVHCVEKFISKARSEYKLPGLYVIDAIVRASKQRYGEKDPYGPRFQQNLTQTFVFLLRCGLEDQENVREVVRRWQRAAIFPNDVCESILNPGGDTNVANSSSGLPQSALAAVADDFDYGEDEDDTERLMQLRQRLQEEEKKALEPAKEESATPVKHAFDAAKVTSFLSKLIQPIASVTTAEPPAAPVRVPSPSSPSNPDHAMRILPPDHIRVVSLCLWFGNVADDGLFPVLDAEMQRIGLLDRFVVNKEKHCAFAHYKKREEAEYAFQCLQAQDSITRRNNIKIRWARGYAQKGLKPEYFDWETGVSVIPIHFVTRRNLPTFCDGCVIDRATIAGALLEDLVALPDASFYDSRIKVVVNPPARIAPTANPGFIPVPPPREFSHPPAHDDGFVNKRPRF